MCTGGLGAHGSESASITIRETPPFPSPSGPLSVHLASPASPRSPHAGPGRRTQARNGPGWEPRFWTRTTPELPRHPRCQHPRPDPVEAFHDLVHHDDNVIVPNPDERLEPGEGLPRDTLQRQLNGDGQTEVGRPGEHGCAHQVMRRREPCRAEVGVDKRPILQVRLAVAGQEVEHRAPHHLLQGVVVPPAAGESGHDLRVGGVLALPRGGTIRITYPAPPRSRTRTLARRLRPVSLRPDSPSLRPSPRSTSHPLTSAASVAVESSTTSR